VRTFPSIKVWAPWNLELQDHCGLGDGVDCYSVGKITIGRNATVSQDTVLCTASHDYTDPTFPLTIGEICVGEFVWLAAQVFVMPNVLIGEGTVVGVSSTVMRDLPTWSVAVGTPCRVIGPRKVRGKGDAEAAAEELDGS
jgi:putative colanic acid biosynthesis acetyltransferase WcaF